MVWYAMILKNWGAVKPSSFWLGEAKNATVNTREMIWEMVILLGRR